MCPRGPVVPRADSCTASSPKPRVSVLFTRIYLLPRPWPVVFQPLSLVKEWLCQWSPGPEAWTLDGSLAGPHQAWTAQTPRRRPASLHPGKQTARYRWPVGFLAFTGGALEWRLPGSAQRVVAPPQKVPPAE